MGWRMPFHKGVADRWQNEWQPEFEQLEDAIDRRRHVNLCISRYLRDELPSQRVISNELADMYLQLAWLDWMEFDRWGMKHRYLSRKLEFLELAFDAYMQSGDVDTNVDMVIIHMLNGIMEYPKSKFHARAVSFMQQVRQLYGTKNLPENIRLVFTLYDDWYSV